MNLFLSIVLTVVVLSAKSHGEFIIGNGIRAEKGEFPYQARLRMNFPEPFNGELCGGSLINNQWVLTAAHCLRRSEKVRATLVQVQLGVLGNLDINNETGSVTQYTKKFFLHPKNYVNGVKDSSHDLALIPLPTPVTFSATIQPIKLAKRNAGRFTGKKAVVSGWGKFNDQPLLSSKLLYTWTTVITNDECALTYGKAVYKNKNLICAKTYDNSGACQGDSGDPLAIGTYSDDRTLIGLVAYKNEEINCRSSTPRGFVFISTHRDWIRKHSGT